MMRYFYLPAIVAICLASAAATSASAPQTAAASQPSPEVEALTAKIRTAMATAIKNSEGLAPSQVELAVSQAIEDVISASGADPMVAQAALRLALAREHCLLRDDQTWSHVGCEGLYRVATAVGLGLEPPGATGGNGGIAGPGVPPPRGNGPGPDYRPGN
jgi:hypothetical protein